MAIVGTGHRWAREVPRADPSGGVSGERARIAAGFGVEGTGV